MRLSPCLLLIILAVCYYEANSTSIVCDDVVHESIMFVLKCEEDVKKELEKYHAPPEAVQAKLEVKRCVDKMSYEERFQVALALANVVLQCQWYEGTGMLFPIFDVFG